MLKTLVSTVQKQISNRRRYLQAVAEIDTLTNRDLADLRADPHEMRRLAWLQVYGDSHA